MATITTAWETSSAQTGKKDDSTATQILKILVGHLLGSRQDHEPNPLNLTSVLKMFDQLTDEEQQVLYNATETRSREELIYLLNVTIMQPRQFEASLMEFQEYRVQKILHLYIPPILILLGTFGNLFSFIVLRRKPMIKVSSYLYLAVLAIIDTLVLYNGLLRIWMVELMNFDYQGSGNWICKLTVAFGYVSSDLSVWLIIAVTVERYIVVCFPFQASSMCNVSRARKVIVGLLLLMLSLNVHFMWTAEIVEEQGVSICRGGDQFRQLVEEIWPWVDTLIYSFLPFVTITILNVLIIREVAGAHSSRMRMIASESDNTAISMGVASSCSGARRGNTCEGTRLTALLLTVSFTFLLLTLPNNIALILSRFWNQKYEGTDDQLSFEERRLAVHGMAQFKLITTITELLMYTNHSINFFLYCATGNKFRQQILELFRCIQRHPQPQTQAEQSWVSHSVVRRTSHTLLNSEMTQTVRPMRRKNSNISNIEAEKIQENENFLHGQHRVFVSKKGNFTANMKQSSCGINNFTFSKSFNAGKKQQFADESANNESSKLDESSFRNYHQKSAEIYNKNYPGRNHECYLETCLKRSSENNQVTLLENYQDISAESNQQHSKNNNHEKYINNCQERSLESFQERPSEDNQENTSENYKQFSITDSHDKFTRNCKYGFLKNCQEKSSENYQERSSEKSKEIVSENYQERLLENYQERLLENYQERLLENYQERLLENYQERLLENYQERLLENYQERLLENYQERLLENYQERLLENYHERLLENYRGSSLENNEKRTSNNYGERFLQNNETKFSENYHSSTPNYQLQRGSPLKVCFRDTTNDFQSVQYDLSLDVDIDNNDRRPVRFHGNRISCKIYNFEKAPRHFVTPKQSIFSSALSLTSRDNEYFLLKPVIRLCDSAAVRLCDSAAQF